MQPRTLPVMVGSTERGTMTVTGETQFALQYGHPRREQYFAADAAKLEAFLLGRAVLHVWLEGRTVRIGSYIRGN